MSAGTHVDGDLDIDVASLFGSLWRDKVRLLTTAFLLTGLVAGALFFVSPKYKSETRIFIEQGESVFTRPQGTTAEDARANLDPEGITSQVQLLTSADVLSRLLEDEVLAKNSAFQSMADLSLVDSLLTLINRGPQADGRDRVIMKLRGDLNIYRVENSRVIVVEYSSKNANLAAAVPNAIAAAYLKVQSQAKQNSDSKATKFLKTGIDKLEASLPKAEAAVARYRSQNDILIGQNNSILATQQLSELSSELSRVRGVRANASAKAASVKAQLSSGASIDSIPEVLSSSLMQRLTERQVQLKSQIADLSTTLLDGHPQLKGLRSQLSDLNIQIGSEMAKVLVSLETEAQTAALREKELFNQLNGLKAESSRVGDDEVQLRELEREVATQRDQLASYRARYSEALDRQAPDFQSADARVIQNAEVPGEAYFPKLVPSIVAAFVGWLLLLSVIKLMRELFSGRAFRAAAIPATILPEPVVSTPQDIPGLLGPMPQDNLRKETSDVSIAHVAASLIDKGEACVMIISPEGKRACASSVLLARALSDQGLRIVLLDLTGDSAAARPMLDGFALPGITNLLASEAAIADVIHNDCYSEASVIPTGTADTAKAAKAIARLPMILNSLSSAYDMVIVECGAATPAGISRLVMPGSALLFSYIDAESEALTSAMVEFVSAGYDELDLVTPVGAGSHEPLTGRFAA